MLILCGLWACTLAWAQPFPIKPIKIVVPFAAGGVVDITARQLGIKLSEAMGQPVLVENKAGAGGTIAAETVAKSPPDGYTLLLAFDSHAVNPLAYKNLRYNTFEDFAPISFVGSIPLLFVAHPNLPANDIPTLVRLLKSGQLKVSYGSVGAGSSGHLAAEQFNMLAGTSMLHVPFKGGAPAMNALMGGQVQLVVFAATAAVPLVQSGKIKPLAVSGGKRSSALPQVPTMTEAGFPQISSGAWMGLLAPAGTPAPIVRRLQQEVAKAVQDPDLVKKLGELAIALSSSSPEELGAFIKAEHDKWSRVIKEANINMEQ
jgi:tripartite-type tricarboxylate transporter receptor subunit TctC